MALGKRQGYLGVTPVVTSGSYLASEKLAY